jgi:hypothetical protein
MAEVKERVKLYLYYPSGPSWPVLGCSLPLPLPFLVPQINKAAERQLHLNFYKFFWLAEVSVLEKPIKTN